MATPVPAAAAGLTVADAADVRRDRTARWTSSSARSTCPRTRPRASRRTTPGPRRRWSRTTRAHRWTPDVPMMIPEVNSGARRRDRGAAAPARHPARLRRGEAQLLDPELRAGAPPAARLRPDQGGGLHLPGDLRRREDLRDLARDGRQRHPVHQGRGGEEREGAAQDLGHAARRRPIAPAAGPVITAQCIRVPVSDGHMAAVFVGFERKPPRDEILAALEGLRRPAAGAEAPQRPDARSSTTTTTTHRPQTRLDRDAGRRQAVTHRPAPARPALRLALRRRSRTTPCAARPAARCSPPSCWRPRASSPLVEGASAANRRGPAGRHSLRDGRLGRLVEAGQ